MPELSPREQIVYKQLMEANLGNMEMLASDIITALILAGELRQELRPVRWCLTHDNRATVDSFGSQQWRHTKDCEVVEGGLWLPKEQT